MSSDSKATEKTEQRTCLYVLLGVEKNATNEELKQAYKKQALLWHPDRNINNAEEATHRFKEINEAYEILSDKNERAWYDCHRSQILRGIDPKYAGTSVPNDEDDFDLLPYFSPFAFHSFDDSHPDNFYKVYKDLFLKISALEQLSAKKTPNFGSSQTKYNNVERFYDFWLHFSSRRNFRHRTKYNLNDASNGRIKRLMQKENKRLIASERREWEETVHALVLFIQKRDKRILRHLIEQEKEKKEEMMRERQFEREVQDMLRRDRQRETERELNQLRELAEQRPEEYEEVVQEFECVICNNKVFKSEKTFRNHERSKKHMRQFDILQKQLQMEEELLFASDAKDELERVNELITRQVMNESESTTVDCVAENTTSSTAEKEMLEKKLNDPDYVLACQYEQNEILDKMMKSEGESNGQGGDREEEEEEEEEEEGEGEGINYDEVRMMIENGIEPRDIFSLFSSLSQEEKNRILELHTMYAKNVNKKKMKKKNKKKKNNRIERSESGEDEQEKKKEEVEDGEKKEMDEENVKEKKCEKKKRRRKMKTSGSVQQKNEAKKSMCKACGMMFNSKSKMFKHLEMYPAHALVKNHKG